MRIVTYMGFTLLSILIQFSVMDFIQEKLPKDDGMLDLNVTKSNEDNYKSAISVRDSKQVKKIRNLNIELKKNVYRNITKLIQSGLSTEMTSTIMDIFYDDNASTTDFSFTTELFLSTEVDNVTEISFPIEVKPLSKPDIKPKNIIKDCECDLMYEICDINCCCDSDCTDEQKHLFPCNEVNNETTGQNDGVCYAYLFHNDDRYKNGIIDNMLCIVKVNLPEKRKFTHKYKESLPQHHYKWRSHNNLRSEIKFSKDVHKIGDPIWLLGNQSINHIDLPSPLTNDYCNIRKPMGFLRDEEIKCIVKLKDLEMFHIYNLAEQTKIISVKNVSANSSSLNCSSLYCANWTILVCNEMACKMFNKSIHEPTCSENICTNIALMVDYIFYAHEAQIINVTVKLYVQKISMEIPYLMQKIRVKFLLSNKSIDEIVKYSGNPGYQKGLNVIFSRAQGNYTQNFLNRRIDSAKYFALPVIKNKQCFFPNFTDNFIVFGSNKRIKCKYVHENLSGKINKEVCNEIQVNILKLLLLNKTMAISPFGNPQHVSDEEWILLNVDNAQQESVYGVNEHFKILCCNLITRISLSFAFTYSDEKGNKILSVKQQVMVSNKSFTMQDMSTVITIDISFIDVTKPAVFEYAGSPHIDINLPKDFFFPSNRSDLDCSNLYILFYCCIIIIFK